MDYTECFKLKLNHKVMPLGDLSLYISIDVSIDPLRMGGVWERMNSHRTFRLFSSKLGQKKGNYIDN